LPLLAHQPAMALSPDHQIPCERCISGGTEYGRLDPALPATGLPLRIAPEFCKYLALRIHQAAIWNQPGFSQRHCLPPRPRTIRIINEIFAFRPFASWSDWHE
jgi:hypothetical protein